jgi:hypothetical protein
VPYKSSIGDSLRLTENAGNLDNVVRGTAHTGRQRPETDSGRLANDDP